MSKTPARELPLTQIQAATLEFIGSYIDRCGFPPTMSEIAAEFGRSKVTVLQNVCTLETKGMLKRILRKARGIVLTEAGRARCKPRLCQHCGQAT